MSMLLVTDTTPADSNLNGKKDATDLSIIILETHLRAKANNDCPKRPKTPTRTAYIHSSVVLGNLNSATMGTMAALTIADMTLKAKMRTEKWTLRSFRMQTKLEAVSRVPPMAKPYPTKSMSCCWTYERINGIITRWKGSKGAFWRLFLFTKYL